MRVELQIGQQYVVYPLACHEPVPVLEPEAVSRRRAVQLLLTILDLGIGFAERRPSHHDVVGFVCNY